MLPIELTLIHDLPVAQNRDRMRRPLGPPGPAPHGVGVLRGRQRVQPEETATKSKDYWFWVKGTPRRRSCCALRSRACGENRLDLRKPLPRDARSAKWRRAKRVTVSTGRESQTFDMTPGELKSSRWRSQRACRSAAKFSRRVICTPCRSRRPPGSCRFSKSPCAQPGQMPEQDPRFLGAMIHVIPEYTDAEYLDVARAGGVGSRERKTGGVLDAP